MTIADKLEAILPATGPVTKDQRTIAVAVCELRVMDHASNLWIQTGIDTARQILEDEANELPWAVGTVACLAGLVFGAAAVLVAM